MNYHLVCHHSTPYIHCQPGWQLTNEQSAVDLLAICAENATSRILIASSNLPESFYDLRTGLAGAILGRFSIYRVRAAFHVPSERLTSGRFSEMAWELNRADEIHISDKVEILQKWLVQDGSGDSN